MRQIPQVLVSRVSEPIQVVHEPCLNEWLGTPALVLLCLLENSILGGFGPRISWMDVFQVMFDVQGLALVLLVLGGS